MRTLFQPHVDSAIASVDENLAAIQGSRVLIRADLNVPLDAESSMLCDYRLRRVAGLVRRLIRARCKVAVMSHLGQPGGRADPQFSLRSFVEPFAQRVGYPVLFANSCVGPEAKTVVNGAGQTQVVLLENLRFHKGEEEPSWDFAAQLAQLADVYVNDAFSVSHRAHASVVLLPHLLPAYAGPAFLDEYRRALQLTQRLRFPVVALSGGRKLDKLVAYRRLLPVFDRLLLGSGFAQERNCQDLLGECFDRVIFPMDMIACNQNGDLRIAKPDEMHPGEAAIDLGPETAQYYCAVLKQAGTIIFNGSLGILPLDHPMSPTLQILHAVAQSAATKVACGGTGCAMFLQQGLGSSLDYLFPGGGATLAFLDGQSNPAITALQEARQTARHAAVTLMNGTPPRGEGSP